MSELDEISHCELRVLESGEISFTVVYRDGQRLIEWCGFWRALWLCWKFTMRDIEVRDL